MNMYDLLKKWQRIFYFDNNGIGIGIGMDILIPVTPSLYGLPYYGRETEGATNVVGAPIGRSCWNALTTNLEFESYFWELWRGTLRYRIIRSSAGGEFDFCGDITATFYPFLEQRSPQIYQQFLTDLVGPDPPAGSVESGFTIDKIAYQIPAANRWTGLNLLGWLNLQSNLQGSAYVNLKINPMLEFEVPFFDNHRVEVCPKFRNSDNRYPGPSDGCTGALVPIHSITGFVVVHLNAFSAGGGAHDTVMIDIAAGDDFCYSQPLGAHNLYLAKTQPEP
jgi:hypothetical protein